MQSQRKRNKQNGGKSNRQSHEPEDIPKPFQSSPLISMRRRYQQAAATGGTVAYSLSSGHDQFLTVVAVTGNAVPYADMWRIRKIKIWNASTTQTCTFQTSGLSTTDNFQNSRERTISVPQARSTSQPEVVTIHPTGPLDPLGSWHETSNVNFAGSLFTIAAGGTSGVTMDIWYDIVLNSSGLPNGYSIITSVTTLGTLVARNIIAGAFVPTGVNVG